MSTQTNETDTPNFPEEKNGADARHFGYVIQNPLPPSLTVDNGGGGEKCAVDATPKTMSAFREANFGTTV